MLITHSYGSSIFIRKVLFLDESGHEPQLRAVHADGATAKEAKMGGEARPSGSGVGLMHRLLYMHIMLVHAYYAGYPLLTRVVETTQQERVFSS